VPRAKRTPFDPAKVHDRRATDLLRNAQVAVIEVDDPFEVGAKILTIRSIRNDPLAGLHARGSIDEAMYLAGRAFQRTFETAERGPRAIDPSKEAVDGGLPPEPLTDFQVRAMESLKGAYRVLGQDGTGYTHDVLIHGKTFLQVSTSRGWLGEHAERYVSRRFRECLECLAKFYGLCG